MSKLDEALYLHCPELTDVQHIKLRDDIKDLFLQMLGEDEKEIGNHGKNEHIAIPTRNNFRFNLRNKVEEL